MTEIENMLRKKKLEIDELEIPEDLEERLVGALKSSPSKSMRKWAIRVAALLIAFLLVGYNFDTLAFYAKKLVGYDGVMSNTLKQLNELGKGQIIGESHTFKNGVKVTLDGVMMDDNQLLIFYTIKAPNGDLNKIDTITTQMKGALGRYYEKSGQGEINEEKNEIKWISSFDAPYFFEKKIKWCIDMVVEKEREIIEIDFTLDRNKAMGHSLKKELNKQVEIDGTKIRFQSITASPTTTIINGKIQNILELVKDHISGERIRPDALDAKLIANGKEVAEQGSGMSTDRKGITFQKKYDALPADLEKLEIQIVRFVADCDVNEEFKIVKDGDKQSIKVLDQTIEINKVWESKGETYVTITTEENVLLSKVYLLLDGKKVELEETVTDKHEKMEDGTINHTRTLRFNSAGKDLKLDIIRIKYAKNCNQIIEIPID